MEQQNTGAKYLQVPQKQEYFNPQLPVPSLYAIFSYYTTFFLQLNRRIQDKGQSTLNNKVSKYKYLCPRINIELSGKGNI
jgi:hypothetical protein